jgi:acetate kinase
MPRCLTPAEHAADAGGPGTLVALKALCYRVRKYIGAYLTGMVGIDVLVFTGGIRQGSAKAGSFALQGLECMGMQSKD